MPPESASLLGNREFIQERVFGRYGTLSDKRSTVCPVGRLLEYTVPVLNDMQISEKGFHA
jgi:hypothetical protein